MKTWIPAPREAPGIALAFAIGLVAVLLRVYVAGSSPYISDVFLAIVLGALVRNTALGGWLGLKAHVEGADDRYDPGLRFTAMWILRFAIILMGLRIGADLFHFEHVLIALGVLACALPTAFCVAHLVAGRLGLRREMGDLLSIGTMVCGASAINALSPVVYARRNDQGLAISAVFLFSVVALILFYPIGQIVGLSEEYFGLWSGLAVNDLSSSVAVGSQFGEDSSLVATAAKSARILLLGPLLLGFSLLRRRELDHPEVSRFARLAQHVPLFIVGYFLTFAIRVSGDRLFAGSSAWTAVLEANGGLTKFLIVGVCAGVGLQIRVRTVLETGWRAVAAGGSASLAMAGLSLFILAGVERGDLWQSLALGALVALLSFGFYRVGELIEPRTRRLLRRYESGAPISLREAVELLNYHDAEDTLTPGVTERILFQLYPALGELMLLRESRIVAPINYRRLIYWTSAKGRGSLVGILWPPDTRSHIHSHNYNGFGKNIEGRVEVCEFDRAGEGRLRLTERAFMDAGTLMQIFGRGTIHTVCNVCGRDAIDMHFYGSDLDYVAERFEPEAEFVLEDLEIGDEFAVRSSPEELPEELVPESFWCESSSSAIPQSKA